MSFPRYPEYKDSGVEWLGEVPSHWEVTQLKRYVDPNRQITYGIVQAGPNVSAGIPYIRPADMTEERGVLHPEEVLRTSPEIASSYLRSTITTGDIVCSIGPSFGKIMITPPWLEGANLTQGTARIAIQKPNMSKFFFWVLRASVSYSQWESSVGGATFRALNLGPLAGTTVAVPPIAEQAAIVTFLDCETAKIDALVAEQEKLIALLQEKRQAVISHAVTKGLDPNVPMKDSGVEWLGEVPGHWQSKRLKFLASNIKAGPFGSALTKDMYVSSGYRVYGQEQVIPGDFSIGDYYIDQTKFAELAQYEIRPDDLLISCVGTFGKIAVVPVDAEPGIINPRLIRLRTVEGVLPLFLAEVLRSAVTFEQFSVLSRGGTMDVINIGTLSDIWIALPPIAEQSAILSEITSQMARFDALMTQARTAITLLQERRTALISAAVTGQIDVRGWESAEAVA